MKFLTIPLVASLALVSNARMGNLRNLEQYNCLTYDADGKCTTCIPRTVLKDGDCVAVSDQCKTWSEVSGDCTSCYDGWNLNSGKCQAPTDSGSGSGSSSGSGSDSGSGSSSGSSSQPPANCMEANADGTCKQCYSRYFVKDGQCTAVSDQCKTWDGTSGDCTACYDGWSLNAGKCEVASDSSSGSGSGSGSGSTPAQPNCQEANSDGTCKTCAYRFVLKDGKCAAVSDDCKEWNATSGDCTSCYGGYSLKDGKCQISQETPSVPSAPSQDIGCVASDANGACQKCAYRWVLKDGSCVSVSDLCKTWDEATAACLTCYGGYQLSADGKCIV